MQNPLTEVSIDELTPEEINAIIEEAEKAPAFLPMSDANISTLYKNE